MNFKLMLELSIEELEFCAKMAEACGIELDEYLDLGDCF